MLQCVAVCCKERAKYHRSPHGGDQRVAVCCSVLQRVAVCYSVLQCVVVCCSLLQCVAVCCSVLQCVAVCCSALQCVVVLVTRNMMAYVTCLFPQTSHQIQGSFAENNLQTKDISWVVAKRCC